MERLLWSIIIEISGFGGIEWNVPTHAKTSLEVEAKGSRDWNVGLVKVDGAAVVGEALLEVKPRIKTVRTPVVEKRIAHKLLGIEASGEAVIAFFVVEFNLWHDVIVGFYAQMMKHVATAQLN